MPAPAHAQRVRDVVGPHVAAAGLYLEDVEVTRAGARSVVRIILDLEEDATGGLDLETVADVTREISAALDATDVIPGEYTLEVSSPGVSRPLVERRHFVRARGRLVTVHLLDGSSTTGRLEDVDRSGGDVVLELVPEPVMEKGRRRAPGEPVRVRLADVRAGQVEVELHHLEPQPGDDAPDDDAPDEHDTHDDEPTGTRTTEQEG